MTNKNKANNSTIDNDSFDQIQQLSHRFIELWQQQLSIISENMIMDSQVAKNTDKSHDNMRDKTTANATPGAAPIGSSSLDVIDILQQLSRDVKRIDQRITGIEQQIFSSKPTDKSPSIGTGFTKKPKDK